MLPDFRITGLSGRFPGIGRLFFSRHVWSTGGLIPTQESQKYLENNPVPTSLCPPQVSHGPDCDRTRVLRDGRPTRNGLNHGTAQDEWSAFLAAHIASFLVNVQLDAQMLFNVFIYL